MFRGLDVGWVLSLEVWSLPGGQARSGSLAVNVFPKLGILADHVDEGALGMLEKILHILKSKSILSAISVSFRYCL